MYVKALTRVRPFWVYNNDNLSGHGGDDIIEGNEGDDKILGNADDDVL
jgi:Ca2+-binding RTX toxin-like protein